MPNRHTIQTSSDLNQFGNKVYRFGYNGMESDFEVKNITGSHYDLGDRNYDPRLGRMFSVDPRTAEYSWQTPYAYRRNNPMNFIDYMGGGDPPDDDGTASAGDTDGDYGYQCSQTCSSEDGWVDMSKGASTITTYEMTFKSEYTPTGGNRVTETGYNKTGFEVIDDGASNHTVEYNITYDKRISPWVNNEKTISFATDKSNILDLHRFSIMFVNKENKSAWFDGNKAQWNSTLVMFTYANLAPGMINLASNMAIYSSSRSSFSRLVAMPRSFIGKSKMQVKGMLGKGWKEGTYGSNGKGWKFTKGDKSVFYNQSSSAHGGASYYGYSRGGNPKVRGKVKFVGKGYKATKNDKATIIYMNQ